MYAGAAVTGRCLGVWSDGAYPIVAMSWQVPCMTPVLFLALVSMCGSSAITSVPVFCCRAGAQVVGSCLSARFGASIILTVLWSSRCQ